MKGKILESEYNPGWDSWVLKQTKYGSFWGHVYLDEEDEDIDNSFDGSRIAEFDADLKAYKEKAKWLRQRAIGARTLYYNCLLDEKHNYTNDPLLERMEKQVLALFKEADKAREYYERMKDYRPIFIKNLLTKRREVRNKYEK